MSDRESPLAAAVASTGEIVSEAPPEFAFDALDLADLEPLPPAEGESASNEIGDRCESATSDPTPTSAESQTPDPRPPTPDPAGLADAPPLTEDSPFDAPPTFDEPAPDSPRAAIIGRTGMTAPPNSGQTDMSAPPIVGQTDVAVSAQSESVDEPVVEELPIPPADIASAGASVESAPDALSDFDAPVDPTAEVPTTLGAAVATDPEPVEAEAPAPIEITPSQALEALLFSSSEPLAPTRLGSLVGDLDAKGVRRLIDDLNRHYRETGRAFAVEEVAGGFQLLTRPEFHAWLKKLSKSKGEGKLSQTALLTLSIIAYKQPVKRIDIESVRGTACGEVLRMLMDRGLVKIVGREESLGRPLLYGTTKKFLQVFGLGSLKELPRVEELNKP